MSWCGGVRVGLGGVVLSALPMRRAGLASAGQVDSSSEETSSSSNESEVEVIAPHPQELPLHTLNSSLPGAWLHRQVGPDQFSKCFRMTGS